MKKVLFITARIPSPLDDGWKIRTFHLIQGYANNGWLVDLLSFCNPNEVENFFPDLDATCYNIRLVPRNKSYSLVDLLKGLFFSTPFNVYNYHIRFMADVSKEMAEKNHYDLIQIEDVIMAQYFNDHMQNIPKILDMHNVESNLLCRYAEKDGNFFKRIYAKLTASKLEKYEVGISEKFSSVLTCSSDDGALLMKNGVNIPVRVVPNGVDCEYFKPDHNADSFSKDLVFVGSMDYHANRTGVIFFVNHILPLIIKKLPDVHFFIVGKNPTKEVCSLACEKITVTGMVPDVREYLKRAKVVVVPLLVGGGTRLKILEAMSMARPVVSTSLGAEGIGAIHKKHIFLADDPSSFSASIVKLLNDFELSKQMGVSASQFINDNYCWNKIQDELLSFINGQFT